MKYDKLHVVHRTKNEASWKINTMDEAVLAFTLYVHSDFWLTPYIFYN